MHLYKYLVPALSNMAGIGFINRRKPPTLKPVVTLRGAPQNNHVVTYRGNFVLAINVTGR